MKTSLTKFRSVCVLLALCPMAAQAIPYSFSTGDAIAGDPLLLPNFSGLSVSGTFDYDPTTPSSGTAGAGVTAGSTIYSMANTNLIGSVGAYSFSDLVGGVLVGDDKWTGGPAVPPPPKRPPERTLL